MKSIILVAIAALTILKLSKGDSDKISMITVAERRYVVNAAENYLDSLPVTITSYPSQESSGGLHDFFSESDYWWPDPENPNAPYIKKDGETNPENFINHRLAMIRLSTIVGLETSAWLLTGDRKFANAIDNHLKAWFINSETMMNPNLMYAAAIKGRYPGRSFGIIDAIHLIEVARSVEILEKNKVLREETVSGVKKWFMGLVTWLTMHPNGIEEMNAKNNHGTCWIMQVSAFARLTGDSVILQLCRNRFKEVFSRQMAPDGSFPLELARTKPFGYSLFNLDAFFTTAEILKDQSNNLYDFSTSEGNSLKTAAEFLFPYVKEKKLWPYPQDIMYWDEWPVRHPFLLFAGKAYNRKDFTDLWKKLNGFPTTGEIIRNLPIRNPIIWLIEQPINS